MDCWVEEEFFELLFSDEVHSFDFDLWVGEDFFLNYWKLPKLTYHILVTRYIHLIFDFWVEEEFSKLLETFEVDLSYTSDEIHSFDFDFWVEEEFYKLLETMEGDLLRSPHEVHSSDFDFGVEEEI